MSHVDICPEEKTHSFYYPKAPRAHASTMTPSLHLQKARVRHILRGPTLRPKLTISAPNDVYEQEADRAGYGDGLD
jgi:hypothetical protein